MDRRSQQAPWAKWKMVRLTMPQKQDVNEKSRKHMQIELKDLQRSLCPSQEHQIRNHDLLLQRVLKSMARCKQLRMMHRNRRIEATPQQADQPQLPVIGVIDGQTHNLPLHCHPVSTHYQVDQKEKFQLGHSILISAKVQGATTTKDVLITREMLAIIIEVHQTRQHHGVETELRSLCLRLVIQAETWVASSLEIYGMAMIEAVLLLAKRELETIRLHGTEDTI